MRLRVRFGADSAASQPADQRRESADSGHSRHHPSNRKVPNSFIWRSIQVPMVLIPLPRQNADARAKTAFTDVSNWLCRLRSPAGQSSVTKISGP
jgi:hypothetical protein